MKETKYNCRTFVNHRNQVIVRVRWNRKKFEVAFSTGLHADPLKWNLKLKDRCVVLLTSSGVRGTLLV